MPETMSVSSAQFIWSGIVIAAMDTAVILLLIQQVKPGRFLELKWTLVGTASILWSLFSLFLVQGFWDPYYRYFYPAFFRSGGILLFVPLVYGLLALLYHWLAFQLPGNPILVFCLLAGFGSLVEHMLGITGFRILEVPMLHDANPLSILFFAVPEYIFYWCMVIGLAALVQISSRRLVKFRPILFLILISVAFASPPASFARSETPSDLVNEVNVLRASQGLDHYRVDPWLMGYAQEHSDYQAATHTSTHLHSDGTLPQEIGLQENVAGGDDGYVTVSVVVHEIWADWGHRHVLIGYPHGDIGAGITLADDGTLYFTVNVRPGSEDSPAVLAQDTPAATDQNTPPPFVPYPTSTPNEDGMIIHVVQEGQTLWSIAQSYGVTVAEILQMNALPAETTDIYPGQNLLIRMGVTGTPGAADTTPSESPGLPEVTTAPIIKTAEPTRTVVPSPTQAQEPIPSITAEPAEPGPGILQSAEDYLGWIILGAGMIGLVIVIFFGFRRSPR